MLESHYDIGTAEQRSVGMLSGSFLRYEQHGDHHDGHVVMPTGPLADLEVNHSAIALGVLKGAFDPIPAALPQNIPHGTHFRMSIQCDVRGAKSLGSACGLCSGRGHGAEVFVVFGLQDIRRSSFATAKPRRR